MLARKTFAETYVFAIEEPIRKFFSTIKPVAIQSKVQGRKIFRHTPLFKKRQSFIQFTMKLFMNMIMKSS